MGDTSITDPLDISKEQDIIKDAQKELSKIDVLVCGGCHEVFHFVEEFQTHKSSEKCTNVSVLKCEKEEKPQIWGFTLWKTKQIRTFKEKGEVVPTSWDIYQKWTKLTQVEKDLWVTAGKTIQSAQKLASLKVMKDFIKDDRKVDKDPLALDDGEVASVESDSTAIVTRPNILKKITFPSSKKALRTTKDNEKEEYTVEKIMGKRFNPRKRQWEFEVKWENYVELTWEPMAHLENCKALVREFEEKLKAEKEKKEKDKPVRGRGRPRLNADGSAVKLVKKQDTPPVSLNLSPEGRPQRTSKQKALNQVKAWCGNISDEESGLKRPFDDDGESDDSFEKKMKLEGESDDTEEDEPKAPIKKLAKLIHTYNNGTGKKLPDNVLIPDAQGVVRISQKQLPSLSSGVYIMSKSSGIIKLDPTASKIATSGGQAIVKVSPKIGQTQIKIIKKEDGSKRVVQVKGPEQMIASTPIVTPVPKARIVQTIPKPPVKKDLIKKPEPPKPVPVKAPETKKEEAKPLVAAARDEDSDDGLPELEFPTDLPLPGPDSPPGDFILDPFTGKVAGMDYPEVPEPVPTPAASVGETKKETSSSPSLDNIVKLAAADITEEDLKPEAEPITKPESATTESVATVTSPPRGTTSAPAPVVTTTPMSTKPSILNAAIASSNILQKTLQNPRPKTQPRIINQSVARPRTTVGAVVRTPIRTTTPARPKQSLPSPKSKFNISPVSPVSPVRNVYSAKSNNITKKIGQTTIYKTRVGASPTVKKSPVKATKPISMPSLDEEPTGTAPKVAQVVAEVPTVATELSTFALAAGDRPMFITGDDGTVYQVAGQNEEGQTILVTQDSDGQQQCLLVTSEAIADEEPPAPAQVLMEVQEPIEISEEQPLVAQFIRTEPPSPGGTHKVVVMLPDGDVMVTQVTPEEYASLELDK